MEKFKILQGRCPKYPITAVDYWHDILSSIASHSGWSMIEGYRKRVDEVCAILTNLAQELDSLSENFGIGKTISGGVSVVGGAMGLGGLLLAPFTGGVSAVAAFAGSAGFAGGVGSFGANVGKSYLENNKNKEAKEIIEEIMNLGLLLQEIISGYMTALRESGEYIRKQSEIGEVKQHVKSSKAYRYFFEANKIEYQKNNITMEIESYKDLKRIVKATGLSGTRILVLSGYRTAQRYAITLSIPGFKFWSVSLVQVGSRATRFLPIAGGVFSVGFGLYDCFDGISDIKNKSETATKLRKLATNLQSQGEEICDAYEELMKE